MEFKNKPKVIIYISLFLLIIYLIYKTRNLEKLSIKQPKLETFETTLETAVNNIYNVDVDAIRNISGIANSILTEETFTMPANSLYVNNFVIDGSIDIINKDNMFMNMYPKYMVIAWGDINIPLGWAICDGNRYSMDKDGNIKQDDEGILTPDLRGRFILGAGTGENNTKNLTERRFGEIGGEETHELTLNKIPAHAHNYIQSYSNLQRYTPITQYTPKLAGHQPVGDRIFTSGNNTNHTTLKTGGNLKPNTGKKFDGASQDYSDPAEYTTTPHNNMPPFYVLTYIMKL